MPNNVLLVKQEDFDKQSNISRNIDVAHYRSSILIAQQIRFYDCLGTALIDQLQLQISTNTVTILNQILLDLIAPALVYYSLYDILPFFVHRVENIGVVKHSSENTTSIDKADMIYLRGELEVKGDYFKKELIEYLNKNKQLYPLYTGSCNDCNNNKNNQSTGIIFYK